ncbi:NACHT domain-containing protein [Streptomyces rubrogriseus]|uniref:ATP-binding protein n=1 Tax=Streptomyces rubrogriseus TaxID=194673 RepID=A0A6G3TJE7_9ACTN|nr:ABC transporter ATP-binding protein [Streptomyces rubrogriseus]NEC36837.1 ATP-binding protein [Streptomyces rubrogriseus]
MSFDARNVEALVGELGSVVNRLVPGAFGDVARDGQKSQEPLHIPVLCEIAERSFRDEWRRGDRVQALESTLRRAIGRLDGQFASNSKWRPARRITNEEVALRYFNFEGSTDLGRVESVDFNDAAFDGLGGDRYVKVFYALKNAIAFDISDARLRVYLRDLRIRLATILLDSDFSFTAAAASVPADEASVTRPVSVDGYGADVRELLAISAVYVRDIRIDSMLHVVRTLEPDLLEQLRNTSHPWPRVVVGEAGSGKSTLLWSLHQSLAAEPDTEPLLLPATWLLQERSAEPAERLAGLLQKIARAGSRPVLLLDTADLMLHDEEARQRLLRLLDSVHAAGFCGLYSTRPQEAALLSDDSLRRYDLQPYDDTELDQAVAALVTRYCPDVPHAEVTTRVRQATARGLPVAEVCRSPLLLRMLFDLSAPAEPELGDVDVTRLFNAYWQRRVMRDARTDTETGLRARAADNLSALAGHAAIGLLASGLPGLPAATLRETTAVAAGSSGDSASIEEGLAVLTERGVLVPGGGQVGFLHQTMFEFAAAKGLLARSDPGTIDTLTARATGHGGDLFVGAVLEQVLILAGTNPLLQGAAHDAVTALVASDSEAVQAIGLVAWGHYPALLDGATEALRTAGASALERTTRILPTIAAKPTGQTISQLLRIWQCTTEPGVRTAVLDAFGRLALRTPRDVAEAVDYLDPLQTFSGTTVTSAMRRSFLGVLRAISSQARLLVRSTLVAMLMSGDDRECVELEYLARQWSSIGDDHLLAEILRAADAEGPPNHTVAAGYGKVIAAEWRRAGTWHGAGPWADFLAKAMNPGPAALTLRDEATLHAIGAFVATTNDDRCIRIAIEALLAASDPRVRDFVCHSVLRDILTSESQAAAVLETVARSSLATIGYDAQKGRIDGRQQLLLDLLAQSDLPGTTVARFLPPHLGVQDWKADHRLVRIASAAADHGHPTAQRLLDEVSRNPQMLSAAQLDALFSTRAAHMPESDAVFDAIVSIGTRTGRTADLEKIVNSADRLDGRLDRYGPPLLAHARELMTGSEASKRRGSQFLAGLMAKIDTEMAWPELRAVLDDVDDPRILVQLIRALWKQTPAGDVSAQLDYLGQFIEVRPGAVRPVARPRGRLTDISVADASAWAMLYIFGARTEAATDQWPVVRTLGLYEAEGEEIFVEGRRFLIVCDYLARLGPVDPHRAGANLLDYLTALSTGEFHGNHSSWWRRELRVAVQYACALGDHRSIESLVAVCGTLDNSIAEVITTAIAERHYADAREHLQSLGRADITAALRSFLLELIRSHDRSFGTRAFPEVFAAVTK